MREHDPREGLCMLEIEYIALKILIFQNPRVKIDKRETVSLEA